MSKDNLTRPVQAKEATFRDVGGETVLLNLSTGVYFGLNEVGTFIWQRLDGSHTIDELADAVCASYVVDREQALADIHRLVEELLDAGLIVVEKTE